MKKFFKIFAITVVLMSVFFAAFFSLLGYIYGEDDLEWE